MPASEAIKAPPRQWTPEVLWRAYETLERDKVRGAGAGRLLTDVVSLVRHALGQEEELWPFAERVGERFDRWMAQQASRGRRFTEEQRAWLAAIRDHMAANLEITVEDFDYAPIETMTLESREKLAKIRPRTLAQAGRIPGVSPSDLAQLSIVLLKLK